MKLSPAFSVIFRVDESALLEASVGRRLILGVGDVG
jgi:hypothetical protein